MLVITPAPTLCRGWASYPSIPMNSVSYVDPLEYFAQQAAYDRALAHARAEAARRQRQQELRHRQLEHHLRQQAALEALEQQAALDFVGSLFGDTFSPRHTEEQVYHRRLAQERERRRLAYAQERERYARANDARFQEELLSALGLVHTHRDAPKQKQRPTSALNPPAQPIDVKGKSKAVDPTPVASTSAAQQQPVPGSLDEILQNRLRTETDAELKETLDNVFSRLFGSPTANTTEGASTSGTTHADAIPASSQTRTEPPKSEPASAAEASTSAQAYTPLHRTPALSPRAAARVRAFVRARRARHTSLNEIAEIEASLHTLESGFTLPSHLDFERAAEDDSSTRSTDSASDLGLRYTSANTPVHAHAHALDALLARLDAVESAGDAAVRGYRRGVVKMVENAIGEVRRRVEESRERAERERVERGAENALVADGRAPRVDVEETAVEALQSSDAVEHTDGAVAHPDQSSAPAEEPQSVVQPVADVPVSESLPTDIEADAPSPLVLPTALVSSTADPEPTGGAEPESVTTPAPQPTTLSLKAGATPESHPDAQDPEAPFTHTFRSAPVPPADTVHTSLSADADPSPAPSSPSLSDADPAPADLDGDAHSRAPSVPPAPPSPSSPAPAFLRTLPAESTSRVSLPSSPSIRSCRSYVEDAEDDDDVEVVRHGDVKKEDEWEEVEA
ncbi:hypothetical protein OBBRIDRAFT_200806 [Obba rivulosa]|uniref:BAG domain-containing protein n=1 Tax=Obba rivulosa TaxID=1052685 RepID=A0A8E2DIG1_9APHY|nr:hypothetical protein OBBRIDRAFT_200806 [Obba rivulosa]